MSGREIKSEDDLWKLFWEDTLPGDGPTGPGDKAIFFVDLASVIKPKGSNGSRFPLKDSGRCYALYTVFGRDCYEGEPEQQAVVSQAHLLSVGSALLHFRGDELCVHYFGGRTRSRVKRLRHRYSSFRDTRLTSSLRRSDACCRCATVADR